MCVPYVSFGSKVKPRTLGCVVMGNAVLFFSRYRLLLYSAGSGMNRVQVVLSGFSVRLFCFVYVPNVNFSEKKDGCTLMNNSLAGSNEECTSKGCRLLFEMVEALLINSEAMPRKEAYPHT